MWQEAVAATTPPVHGVTPANCYPYLGSPPAIS